MVEELILKNIDAFGIQQYQRNSYPCFFVDCITDVIAGKSAIGYKNFTCNESFFSGQIIDELYVPEVIQAETLEQVFLMTFLTLPEHKGKKTATISVDSTFRKKIIPGDRLDVKAELNSFTRGLAKGNSIGYLNGEFACGAEFVVSIPSVMEEFRPKFEKE